MRLRADGVPPLERSREWGTEPSQPGNGAAGYFAEKGGWSTVMAYESSCRSATKGTCNRINRSAEAVSAYRATKTTSGGDEEQHEACAAVHFDESGHTLTAVFAKK